MRVRIAANPKPSVSAGKIIEVGFSMPLTGNIPSHKANIIINIGPIQKCGIADMVRLSRLAMVSGHFLALIAAIIPRGKPIKIANNSANAANLNVAGKRSNNISTMGFLE